MKIHVLNAAGDTIRTFSEEVKSGFNRFTWDLRENGVAFPSRREAKPNDDPPRGSEVMPGTYTLHFSHGEHTAQTTVVVHADPRITYAPGTWENRRKANEELAVVVKKATAGFDQIKAMRQTLDLVEKTMVNLPDSTQTQIKEWGKPLRDSLNRLEELYMEPEDVKGIKRNPTNLSSSLWSVRSYLREVNGEPSQMYRYSLEAARRHTDTVVAQVNSLINGDFAAYKAKVEAIQMPLFKPIDPVKDK
ncbi:MAG: hypothetical protein R2795_25845 [Saprospiraceae bacterium]